MDISKNLDEIRKSLDTSIKLVAVSKTKSNQQIMEAYNHCLLYTSDAADE